MNDDFAKSMSAFSEVNKQIENEKVEYKPESNIQSISSSHRNIQRVGQEQIQELLFDNRLSWQAIIYDLINSEQLDPWDIDLAVLSNKFLVKVRLLEEANFFISSKVLLAASFLLRLKSELLLSRDLQSLDDILYGKKEEKSYTQERIELDEDIPRHYRDTRKYPCRS